MATVSTALQMYDAMDAMTRPINYITQNLNVMSLTMNKIVSTEITINKEIEKSTEAQDKFNKAAEETEKKFNKISNVVSKVFAGLVSLGGVAIGGAMKQQELQDMFIARTGSEEVGSAMFEKFKADALKAGADVNDSLKGTLSLFSTTKDTKHLAKLNNMAQRMAMFDTSGGGVEAAAVALKEALSGDSTSLAKRFNLPKSELKEFKLDDLGKSGDIEGFIASFDQLLEKQNMGQAAFETMLNTPTKQVEMLGSNLKNSLASAGESALQTLLPVLQMLNTAFEEGKFQPFFNALSEGISWVVNGAVWLFNIIWMIYEFISANWTIIEPIIWGIVAAVTAWKLGMMISAVVTGILSTLMAIQTLTTNGLTAAWRGLNLAMKANVFVLIASLVIGLIVWLINLVKTNDQVAAFFMRTWNSILNFFDKMPGYFWQVAEWLMAPFVWLAEKVGGLFNKMFNSTIKGINTVLGAINKTFGTDYEIKAEFDIEDFTKDIQNSIKARKEAAFANAEVKAAEREQKVVDMLNRQAEKQAAETSAKEATFNSESLNQWDSKLESNQIVSTGTPPTNNGLSINRVNEVGKINDTVDVSSEDLKTMRELAEIQSIQNFVTLTPTVQVTTGDVHNEADIDVLVSKIEKKMVDEINSSAEGVYM